MINSKFNVWDEVFVKATVREISVDSNGIKYFLDIRETGCIPPALGGNNRRIPYGRYRDEDDNVRYSVTACVKEDDIFQSPSQAEVGVYTTPARVNYMELCHDQDDLK